MNLHIKLSVLLFMASPAVGALGQDVALLETYCISALASMASPIVEDRDVLLGKLNATAHGQPVQGRVSGEYWYGEWQQQLIPVPPGTVMRSEEHHPLGSNLSLEGQVHLGLYFSELDQLRNMQNQVQKAIGFPPLSRSSFELLRLGLSLRFDDFSCDASTPQNMLDALMGLRLKLRVMSQVLPDDVYFIDNTRIAILFRGPEFFRWKIYFEAPGRSEMLRMISLSTPIDARYENLASLFAGSKTPYEYSNGEPQWLRDFFEKGEARTPDSTEALEALERQMDELPKDEHR